LPHIVPHIIKPKKLYCKLTKITINKIPKEVKRHVEGKRFMRLKKEFDEYMGKIQAKIDKKAANKAAYLEKKRQRLEAEGTGEAEDIEESEEESEGSEEDESQSEEESE